MASGVIYLRARPERRIRQPIRASDVEPQPVRSTNRWKDAMSQQNVERVMGRLLTDDGFRRRFAADPPAELAALTAGGVELTSCELAALARFDARVAERCARAVDPRLLKADLRAGVQGRTANETIAPGDTGDSEAGK